LAPPGCLFNQDVTSYTFPCRTIQQSSFFLWRNTSSLVKCGRCPFSLFPLLMRTAIPNPRARGLERAWALGDTAICTIIIGASLSEPHIDEFAVEFVYIYYYYLCLVRRAVSHLQLLFCVHHLIIFVASHVHATLLAIACTKCSMNVRLHFLLRSVYFVIMYLGFYKHFKLFAEQRRETST